MYRTLDDKKMTPETQENGGAAMVDTDLIASLTQFIQHELLDATQTPAVAADDDLLSSGVVDSLGVMRLVAFIESSFQISVPHEDITIDHFISVATIASYISASATNSDSV
jgi:acyl carrier protein